jgi:hypothetical protein
LDYRSKRFFRLGVVGQELIQVEDHAACVGLLDLELLSIFLNEVRMVGGQEVDEVGGSVTTHPTVGEEVIRSDHQLPLLEVVFFFCADGTNHRSIQTAIGEGGGSESAFYELDGLSLRVHYCLEQSSTAGITDLGLDHHDR